MEETTEQDNRMSQDALDRIEKKIKIPLETFTANSRLLEEAPAGIVIKKWSHREQKPASWVVYIEGGSGGINAQAQDPMTALELFKKQHGHIYNWK